MRIDKRLAALGLACGLVFLISSLPARVVLAIVTPAEISTFGVNGTIWQGSARIIGFNGQQFRNTEWQLSIPRLFIGQIGGDFKTRWGDGFMEGFGTISLTGTIILGETRASFNAASLEPLLGIPRVGGQVSLQLSELEVKENWPYRLVGTGEIRNFSSPLMGTGPADIIGNVSLDFDTATETDGDAITGKLTDLGGPLELKGNLLLRPPGSYTLKARLKARPDAPEALSKNLEFLGPPEADGMRVFQLAGSI
jgi:general secretion pathway protein N